MYCTNCGAEISDNAVVCVKCGCSPTANANYCRNCGAETAKGAVACVKCGCALNGAHAVTGKEGSNRWTIALILNIFLGCYGIHNFYLGNTKTGVMQLVLTIVLWIVSVIFWIVGAFLIFPWILLPFVYLGMYVWPLIDLVKICKGTFPDGKNGGYLTK